MFEPKIPEKGFYVDVGAFHPSLFSTTKIFYERGWRGINIDASPGSMSRFQKERPRDICIETAVGSSRTELTCYMFNVPALNTFRPEIAAKWDGVNGYEMTGQLIMPVTPLADILGNYLPKGQQIDFLTVDVEGLDGDVLASNDWERFRPQFVLAEVITHWLTDALESDVVRVMKNAGYKIRGRTNFTFFFEDASELA
jgi:FkbM family methyltransferase